MLIGAIVDAKEHDVTLSDDQVARISAYTPKPECPYEARVRHINREGMFRLHVALQTGRVNSLEVEQSTGYAFLDKATLDTLKAWRFKPAALRLLADSDHHRSGQLTIRVPVIYTMR